MTNAEIEAAKREFEVAAAALRNADTPAAEVTAMARLDFARLGLERVDPDSGRGSGGGAETIIMGIVAASTLAPFFQSLSKTLGARLGASVRWPSKRRRDDEEYAFVAVPDGQICVATVPLGVSDEAQRKLGEFDFASLSVTAEVYWDEKMGQWLSRPLQVERLPRNRSGLASW